MNLNDGFSNWNMSQITLNKSRLRQLGFSMFHHCQVFKTHPVRIKGHVAISDVAQQRTVVFEVVGVPIQTSKTLGFAGKSYLEKSSQNNSKLWIVTGDCRMGKCFIQNNRRQMYLCNGRNCGSLKLSEISVHLEGGGGRL